MKKYESPTIVKVQDAKIVAKMLARMNA